MNRNYKGYRKKRKVKQLKSSDLKNFNLDDVNKEIDYLQKLLRPSVKIDLDDFRIAIREAKKKSLQNGFGMIRHWHKKDKQSLKDIDILIIPPKKFHKHLNSCANAHQFKKNDSNSRTSFPGDEVGCFDELKRLVSKQIILTNNVPKTLFENLKEFIVWNDMRPFLQELEYMLRSQLIESPEEPGFIGKLFEETYERDFRENFKENKKKWLEALEKDRESWERAYFKPNWSIYSGSARSEGDVIHRWGLYVKTENDKIQINQYVNSEENDRLTYLIKVKTALVKKMKHDKLSGLAAAHIDKTRQRAETVKHEIQTQIEKFPSCPYCFGEIGDVPHADHIYPVAMGGLSIVKNMVYVCSTCNSKKRDYTLREFIEKNDLDRERIEKTLKTLGKKY